MFEGIAYALKNLLKKPFKVGIITPQYPNEENTSNQGVAIHTYYLSRELAKLGCEVHIFTSGKKDSVREEYIGEGKRAVHRMNASPKINIADLTLKRRFSTFLFDNLTLNEIFKENINSKFDIIHSQITMNSALVTKYLNNIDWVHTFHSLERLRSKFNSEESKRYFSLTTWMQSAVEYPDAIISVSQSLKKEIIRNYPKLKEKKIFYIPNAVDVEIFKPEENSPSDKRILFVSRFSSEKGIDLIYKIAVSLLKKDNEIKMEMVVPIDDYMSKTMEKMENQFETLEKTFPERFIWHKKGVGREELAKIYNKCLIYIQPSRYESFGMTVLEAMACRKPVIVSNKGGMPEIVGNAGKVIPFNSKIFVKEILRLVKDYKLRERYARRGLERAKQFSWEKVGKGTLDLYKAITRKSENPEELSVKITECFQGLEKKDEGQKIEKS